MNNRSIFEKIPCGDADCMAEKKSSENKSIRKNLNDILLTAECLHKFFIFCDAAKTGIDIYTIIIRRAVIEYKNNGTNQSLSASGRLCC